jgi:uncharacterized protein (TIGR03382 family)
MIRSTEDIKVRALSTTLFLGLCVGLAPAMHASVSFSSGGSSCGSDCFSASGGGVSVTATGLSATFTNGGTATPTVGNLSNTGTSITQYSPYGLGVCDPSDTNCSYPDHSIDNNGGRVDFVLLQLSVPISSIQLTLSPFATTRDMDITVLTGTCSGTCTAAGMLSSLSGGTVAPTQSALDALFGTGTSNVTLTNYNLAGSGGQNTNLNVNLTGTVGTVNWILVGASTQPYYGDSFSSMSQDYFKLNALTGTTTPEPATFGMAGAALAALGLLRRRKRLSANS